MTRSDDGPTDEDIYTFDEFELYYQSTEKVTDRRLALNAWNYGLCLALMGGIGLVTAWTISKPAFQLVSVVTTSAFAVMGLLLCSLWIGQIRDFKMLNNAKFEVLNAMAPKVRFPDLANSRSAEPFAKEWQILESNRSTQEISSMNIITLKASNAEFLVPRAFMTIFAGIILISIGFAGVNWKSITSAPFLLSTEKAAHNSITSNE
jgi:hypothetical protein